MTIKEEETLNEWLDEQLKAGLIVESSSKYASLCFFIPKKDRTLWLVQDYWKLNQCYNLITQVATLALRLEDELRVRGKGMHNRLSIRRYSVSTRAYILIVVQELGLQ